MRDNHHGYTELIDAYEQTTLYFGAVRVTLSTESAVFEFGIDQEGYKTLRRILQTRPFDQMSGASYRYFFTGSYSKRFKNEESITIGVRIEEGANSKNFNFDCPLSLAQNLKWFHSLKELKEAAALTKLDR